MIYQFKYNYIRVLPSTSVSVWPVLESVRYSRFKYGTRAEHLDYFENDESS